MTIDIARINDALGRPRFKRDEANHDSVVGVVNGLAVTGAGGDVLIVEATSMDAKRRDQGQLTLTGQLGDVMSESGNIALSYIRSQRDVLGIPKDAFDRRFHVHFPAGAIPKDGPSAGVTMTTALVSLLTGRPVRADRGDDRRGHPPGQGPADRRREAEAARRPPGRHPDGPHPGRATSPTSTTSPRPCSPS